jgi:hypothetical protein
MQTTFYRWITNKPSAFLTLSSDQVNMAMNGMNKKKSRHEFARSGREVTPLGPHFKQE